MHHHTCKRIIMKATTAQASPQIIVNVDNAALLNKIKNAIKMIQGVGKIHVSYPKDDSTELDKAIRAAHNETLFQTNDIDELMTSLKS